MVPWLLRQLQGAIPPLLGKGEVMQDLEYVMRSKEDITRLEDARLSIYNGVARKGFIAGAGLYSFIGWFMTGIGLPGVQPLPRWISCVSGGSYLTGKVIYYVGLRMCAELILENHDGEDRMKMELANVILTKHSDDKLLVEAVQKQFVAEHLFNDLHQERPLFRWRLRHSYVDGAFVERLKEMEDEVNSSDDERSISIQTNVKIRSFGDIMHDPLACILGSPGRSMESNSYPTEKARTVLKKSELRARRRRLHRRHRYADKLDAS
ncbi:hypothetical protein EJB05_22261 [Eragrostis curvula]|uniref:Uncharacterized protein n=1 Tax=Eragrostis curvula TaxID=38414 RepID=A0A5J9V5R9_9POAL|nr:hypothetical protein EJB05_22261 [Eragrostis curvula]